MKSKGRLHSTFLPHLLPPNDIVALYTGKNILKGKQLRLLLDAKSDGDLYDRVVGSWKYGQEIELIDKDFSIQNSFALYRRSRSDSMYILFNRYLIDGINHDSATVVSFRLPEMANIRFGKRWGAEIRLGDDDFGYPFWASGNLAIMAIYNRVTVGIHVPFSGGRTPETGLKTSGHRVASMEHTDSPAISIL